MLTSRGFCEAVEEFSGMGYPWLAMGGGGYDLGAVARCWTLAYGIMSERELPDSIPPECEEHCGSKLLRDGVVPLTVQDSVRQEARSFAESSVESVKRLIFPAHRLS
jgi:acetoin utilization protein AcuC